MLTVTTRITATPTVRKIRRASGLRLEDLLDGDAEEACETEGDDEEAGSDLYRALPFDEDDQQREGKDHEQHCQQMTGRERHKRGHERPRTPFHQSGRNRERPPHPGIHPVVEAARNDREPKSRDRPVDSASVQADG